jgi:hypothetical protein
MALKVDPNEGADAILEFFHQGHSSEKRER